MSKNFKMNFKWISSLILLLRVYFCICFTSMYQIDGQTAKARFCSQKYFDSLSFDGQSYKFTVNRRVIRFVSDSPRYTFEVFKLKYNPQTDTFWYSSSTIDYDNMVQLGGIYIDKLNVYIEFYKNVSASVLASKKVSFCPYYQIPQFVRHNCTSSCQSNQFTSSSPRTVLNLCDWRYLEQPCINQDLKGRSVFVWPSIFPKNVVNYLKDDQPCAFVYDPNLEKIVYIFSSRTHPLAINSLRTITSWNSINWFTKDISLYRAYKFVGAFSWPTGANLSTIYLMAQCNWTRHNSVLLELTNTGKFVLSKNFFGCHSLSRSQHLREEKQGATSKAIGWLNAFNITILLLLGLAIVIVVFALLQNVDFTRIKVCFKHLSSAV